MPTEVSLVEVVAGATPNRHSSAMYFFNSRIAIAVPVSVMELDTTGGCNELTGTSIDVPDCTCRELIGGDCTGDKCTSVQVLACSWCESLISERMSIGIGIGGGLSSSL